jgi:hypothetical protein
MPRSLDNHHWSIVAAIWSVAHDLDLVGYLDQRHAPAHRSGLALRVTDGRL